MEPQITQQVPAENVPNVPAVDLVNRIVEDYSAKYKERVPNLLNNTASLIQMDKTSGTNTSALLRKIGEDKEIRTAVIDRLINNYNPDDYEKTEVNVKLARAFGLVTDSMPNTKSLIEYIEHKHKKEQQKARIQIDLKAKTRAALAAGVLSIAAVAPFVSIGTTTPTASAETRNIPVATETIKPIQEEKANASVEITTRTSLPIKEQRILYPKELANSEVAPWIGKLRNSHDSVLVEALFTKELAVMSSEKREKVMGTIAKASAQALVEHYGNTSTIVGIDPGHGGTDIGSAAKTLDGTILLEKELTWKLAQMVTNEIYSQSNGKYFTVMLRPQNPVDLDLDRDGHVSPVERLQKRKALLLQTKKLLEEVSPEEIKNVVYLSLHFNDYPDQRLNGAETFWPNDIAVDNQSRRLSSMLLAQAFQKKIVAAIREAGHPVKDLGAREDPERTRSGTNSDSLTGQYIALGSDKLDRTLASSIKN